MNSNDAATADLFQRALEVQNQRAFGEAQQLYQNILALDPGHLGANINLGFVQYAQGNLSKASAQFADTARRAPQILDQFDKVIDVLAMVIPSFTKARQQAADAHPKLLSFDVLLGTAGVAALNDPFFCAVLENTVVRDVGVECLLTSLRAALLQAAVNGTPPANDASILDFAGALAQQCFINEYVLAIKPDELEQLTRLQAALDDALTKDAAIDPLQPLVLSMYVALHTLPTAQALLKREWPAPVAAVLTQQVREPLQEQDLRAAIASITPAGEQNNEGSAPRWARLPAMGEPTSVDDMLRARFPTAVIAPLGASGAANILVAGCGTGQAALEMAQGYRGAQILAVDASLANVAYAKRKTPAGATVEFAQGDIMALGSSGRTFDLVSCASALNRLTDPLAGWRELIKTVRPGGLMQIGLASDTARRGVDVAAGRAYVADKGYKSSAGDIRRARQDLLGALQIFNFVKLADFFSTGACRDLLFRGPEPRIGIADIKKFIGDNGMKFIGFEFSPPELHEHIRSVFNNNGWPLTDLDRWHAYEQAHPKTFIGTYRFWVQKN